MKWIKLHKASDGSEVWINLAQVVSMREMTDGGSGAYLFLGGGENVPVKERVADILKVIHPEL